MQQQQQRSPAAPPRPSSIEAAVSLLADADRRIFDACRRQLVEWGPLARPSLERAANDRDPRLRARARLVLRSLAFADWLASVRGIALRLRHEQAARPRCSVLEDGLAVLSAIADPGHDKREAITARLDALALRVRGAMRVRTAASAARALAELLAHEEGYAGDASRYWDLDTLLFDRMLVRKKGMPVSLSALYVLVGRRVGLQLSGLRMPDHFLVRVHGTRPVLLDPFHGGRTITKVDCIRYLRSAGYAPETSMLAEVDDRGILLAFLSDL
ncbi:MAG TPA: transglutaminase-like domain-containing protein, partial [Planctomycetota bacterium]|nr:transglutaminase-like domain-containing protein [Planctomycetota bacterium]